MAKNIKITKTLTVPQMDFLQRLDEDELYLFTMDSIQEYAADTENLNEIIDNLVRKGFLYRLERGKYGRSTFRDENVIGTFLVRDGAVAYWSALNLHGLTEQFSNTIFIQTTRQKATASILGTTYQFIKINPQKQAGIIYSGYGNYRYPLTDVEKTVVDCFDLPQYSGGYAELIRAFYRAELQAEKMINYCTVVNNLAAIKRLGFLAEMLDKKELLPFVEFAQTKVNRTYNLFDPFGENTGETDSRWYLRLNLPKETICAIVKNQY